MNTLIIITTAALLALLVYPLQAADWHHQLEMERIKHGKLLDAIRQVETGGHPNPDLAIGDGGLANGWYQLHADFYEDACSLYTSVDWPSYEVACQCRQWSELAIVAVWRRYRKYHNWTDTELCSLFHRGGGAIQNNTLVIDWEYFKKVTK